MKNFFILLLFSVLLLSFSAPPAFSQTQIGGTLFKSFRGVSGASNLARGARSYKNASGISRSTLSRPTTYSLSNSNSFNSSKTNIDKGLVGRGITPAPGTRIRPQGIPESWRVKPTDQRGGTMYINPRNTNENVRVMQGNSKSRYTNSQKPYGRQQIKSGHYLDSSGKVGKNRSEATHIPLANFKFRK